jgi:TatD DNase family protein
MQLVDTHCHLDLSQYKDDVEDVVKRAEEAGVERIICPGISVASSEKCVSLAGKYPSVFAAVGVHPHDADKVTEEDIPKIRDIALTSDKVIAIGEVGLDYFKGYSDPENQKKLFRKSVILAKELDLPLILHSRNADKDLLDIIKGTDHFTLKGVIHCFSGDIEFLEKVLETDLYISFTGNITFEKAANLREMIKHVPLERLLLETDAPYIAPVPVRGKRNEPAYVKYLLDVYTEVYGLTAEDVARITAHNADQLFRLGMEENGKIAYPIRDVLYLNMTHRCTNRCCFCTRNTSYFVKGHNLKLTKEPTVPEIIDAIGDDISAYKEVTFCGLGEPTLRLGAIKKVASYIKDKGGKTRLNTNGEGSLVAARPIAGELAGLIDSVSVSVNAFNKENYDHTCHSVFGVEAYGTIMEFVKECVENGIKTEVTCLDFVGQEAISNIRSMAESTGAIFRLRHLNVVG